MEGVVELALDVLGEWVRSSPVIGRTSSSAACVEVGGTRYGGTDPALRHEVAGPPPCFPDRAADRLVDPQLSGSRRHPVDLEQGLVQGHHTDETAQPVRRGSDVPQVPAHEPAGVRVLDRTMLEEG